MASNEIRFFEGEVKEVTAIVHSKISDEVVVISSATYELRKMSDDTVIENGSCEINMNEATVLLNMHQSGIYELTVTANVGREVIIEKATIKVIK